MSYYTAEMAADTYAEYIAIGCSQSIVFWFGGHPLYPALRRQANSNLSNTNITQQRVNEAAMLGFQFVVEVVVDYVCVVLEMIIGIRYDRVKGLSVFLGVMFMTMAVLTINIPLPFVLVEVA
ncbi:unnamed protein product [Phytophthora lilii]|uniref:Unnamed protein product n=1 Tax=Phytophthora lilii TaxID=2077276 RepID=A0A9W6WNR9_9STRA|nr:unnamed protein product [Phytophthora lilii]